MATIKNVYDHRCEQCDKELFGRADKKYCNDSCRNKANSFKKKKLKWDEPKHVYQISRDLLRNRKIMAQTGVWTDEPKIVSRGMLLDKGFNFEFITNILHTKKGDYRYCYEFGYLPLENGKVLIVMTDKYFEISVKIHDYDR